MNETLKAVLAVLAFVAGLGVVGSLDRADEERVERARALYLLRERAPPGTIRGGQAREPRQPGPIGLVSMNRTAPTQPAVVLRCSFLDQ